MLLFTLLLALASPAHASLEIVSCEGFRYVDPEDPDNLCLLTRATVRNAGKKTVSKDAPLHVWAEYEGDCDYAGGSGNTRALLKALPPGEAVTVTEGACANHRAKREKLGQIAYVCTDPDAAKCFNLMGKNCTFDRTKMITDPKIFRECKIRNGKPKDL